MGVVPLSPHVVQGSTACLKYFTEELNVDSKLKISTINEMKEECYKRNNNINLNVIVLCNNSVVLTLNSSKQVLVDSFLYGDEGLRFHLLMTPPFSPASWSPLDPQHPAGIMGNRVEDFMVGFCEPDFGLAHHFGPPSIV